MKEIGGYFELELQHDKPFPHEDGVLLNTGRNAIEYILRSIPYLKKVYLPFYTCHTVMQPIQTGGVNYSHYHINSDFKLSNNIQLQSGEYLIYTNYFGMMDDYVKELYSIYGNRLIVDNAQAFFTPNTLCDKCMYTPHKFAGVTSGAIAYSDEHFDISDVEIDQTYDRTSHFFARYECPAILAYNDYLINMKKSRNQPIRKMSKLTYRLLRNLDFEMIRKRRIANVNYIHASLKDQNLIKMDLSGKPLMVYPFWTEEKGLKALLQKNKIFCATYWPNVQEWCSEHDLEYSMVNNIVCIPIDQRYGIDDMNQILDIIQKTR